MHLQEPSILDLMKWAGDASAIGVIDSDERFELNRLANRMAFACDHEMPGFVTEHERARFDQLVRKIMPPSPVCHAEFRVPLMRVG
jgi:hypothetical protein